MAGNQVVTVKEADGVTLTDVEILGMGRQTLTASKSISLCIEDKAVLDALASAVRAASSGAPIASVPALAVTIRDVNVNGGAIPGNSAPVVNADQYAQYEPVGAGVSAQPLGATGATGDYLAGVLVFPGTAGCGVVTILDNAITLGTFAGGGTTALADLKPFLIPVGLFSVSGAWKITTGVNVTVVGIGKFT